MPNWRGHPWTDKLCINSIKLNMIDASRHHNPEIPLKLLLEASIPPRIHLFSPAHLTVIYCCNPAKKNNASILLVAPGGRIPLADPSPAECWRHSTSSRCKLLALSTRSIHYSLADPLQQKRAFTGSIGTISATGTVVSGTATPTGNGTIISNGTTGYNGTYPGPPVPYTGGSGSIRGCGVVVLAGLLVGAMVVVL